MLTLSGIGKCHFYLNMKKLFFPIKISLSFNLTKVFSQLPKFCDTINSFTRDVVQDIFGPGLQTDGVLPISASQENHKFCGVDEVIVWAVNIC